MFRVTNVQGGQLSKGDNCPVGQMSRGTDVRGTLVRGTNVRGTHVTPPEIFISDYAIPHATEGKYLIMLLNLPKAHF